MSKRLRRIFGLAVILSWAAGAAWAAEDVPAAATAGGSAPAAPAPTPVGPATSIAGTLPAPCLPPCGDDKGSCCLDSCCTESLWGFEVGGSLHVLRPAINNNAGLIVSTIPPSEVNTIRNFDYDYQLAPSIWAGWKSECGLGLRVTWFRFQESAKTLTENVPDGAIVTSPSQFIFGPPNCLVIATNNLCIQSWDFDLTQCFSVCKLNVTVGAGIRWLRIDQGYGVTNAEPEVGIYQREVDANNFRGVGPTLLLECHRPIGNGCFSLYGNSRVGLLFGDRQESSAQSFPLEPLNFNTHSDSDQLIGFAELELGVEWAKQCGRYRPFIRAGVEGRGYFGTGNAQSGVLTSPGFEFAPGIQPLQRAGTGTLPSLGHNSDIGLYGMTFSAGVRF